MKIEIKKQKIRFDKELNSLDRFAFDFADVLSASKIGYVVVSGYVAILFGRNRSSEDIDFIIEKIDFDRFSRFWNIAIKNFECLNNSSAEKAYSNYLSKGIALRFSKKKSFLPNAELKQAKTALEKWALTSKKEVIVNKKRIYLSNLELQITFKLALGSEKDIEDARFLYKLFKNNLNMALLDNLIAKLNVRKRYEQFLK